jgi:hypothetical protein
MSSNFIIIKYLENTKKYSLLRYLIELTALSYLLKLIFGLIYNLFVYSTTGKTIEDMIEKPELTALFLFGALIIAPLIETLIGQVLPTLISSFFIKNFYLQALISAIFFAILHPFTHYGAIFPVGYILAWTYIIKKQKSFFYGYWITTIMHFVHNAIALIFY